MVLSAAVSFSRSLSVSTHCDTHTHAHQIAHRHGWQGHVLWCQVSLAHAHAHAHTHTHTRTESLIVTVGKAMGCGARSLAVEFRATAEALAAARCFSTYRHVRMRACEKGMLVSG